MPDLPEPSDTSIATSPSREAELGSTTCSVASRAVQDRERQPGGQPEDARADATDPIVETATHAGTIRRADSLQPGGGAVPLGTALLGLIRA
jgi:hypothetical protein